MIRLRDLLEYDNREPEEQPNRDERSTWRVERDGKREGYGAKNSRGDIRYFEDEANARKFAAGEIEGPHPGRPEPKQPPEKAKAKEKYDIR
jgi:hypothetical protein